ncbi:uncharacterized protein [Physcomitrium patens]|uniref:uncharacterized protein isoform X1 n=1 Tax=Physcomitrium patens TaxID=3218 RepID=UPI003CCDC6C0
MDTNATPDHSAMSPSPQQQQELISSQLHCASFRRFAGAGVAGHHHAEANLAQIRQDWMSNRVVYVSRRSERLIGEACLADICPMKYHLPFCLRDWFLWVYDDLNFLSFEVLFSKETMYFRRVELFLRLENDYC